MKGNFAFNRQTGNKFRQYWGLIIMKNYMSKTIALPAWQEDPKINKQGKNISGSFRDCSFKNYGQNLKYVLYKLNKWA